MKSIEITYEGLGAGDIKRKDVVCHLMKSVKVRILAYKGAFDGVFSPEELHKAKVKGTLPKGYSVHHIYPLCSKEGTFTLSNMVVMEDRAHRWLHNAMYSPSISKCEAGQRCCVWIPDMDIDKLVKYNDILPFITSWNDNQIRLGRKPYKERVRIRE